jgi:hypothetical protein
VVPPPGPLAGGALAVAALAAAAVLALTGWAAARPLARRVRDGRR